MPYCVNCGKELITSNEVICNEDCLDEAMLYSCYFQIGGKEFAEGKIKELKASLSNINE